MGLISEISTFLNENIGINEELALGLSKLEASDMFLLFPLTNRLRESASQDRVFLCSIVNAKSGLCAEDCRFCAQSARYPTGIKTYPLLSAEEMVAAARSARKNGAREFGIVTSGKGVSDPFEIETIAQAIAGISEMGLQACVSPGIVSADTLSRWKEAGLSRYHHNLETAPSFFPEICTTHGIEEDIAAVRRAKAAGLPVCVGGLFGMGESWAQRVELAFLLKELEVDSAPLNFLNPIPGTPLADTAPGIKPLEALRTIALFRLVMLSVRIIICGGREANLRDLQALVFLAGANALMIGNYLTTSGREPEKDLKMLADLGLEPAPP